MKYRLKKPALTLGIAIMACGIAAGASSARIRLAEHRLMPETRRAPYPGEGDTVGARVVSFQWPLPEEFQGQYDPLDGMECPEPDKSDVVYRVRYSQDPDFKSASTVETSTKWGMLNVHTPLAPGRWYWQYAYGRTGSWSKPVSFVAERRLDAFLPPSFAEIEAGVPAGHPRILTDAAHWDGFRASAKGRPEAQWYVEAAEKALQTPMKRLEDIDRSQLSKLDTEVQVKSYMTQESRRIIDAEERNCEALIRAYVLTKDARYAREAIGRVLTMAGWDEHADVVGDFNDATLLSLASGVYDACHDMLDSGQKATLLDAVARKGRKMYDRFNNYVEAYLFEDHIWQMTMRITTMAAFATLGELPEAREWAEYCYNLWVARMPGINADGAWHNGDSYYGVNMRTLVEVPYLFSRFTGFNYFDDPWYDGNIMYAMYQQPPFSKSGGNGSLHQRVGRPNANRVGYLNAMARIRHNSYAADYVRRALAAEPDYLKKSLLSKPGDLCWFCLQYDTALPEGPGLEALPHAYVFPQSGLASAISDWDNHRKNAWWSFRSSPYGSHSHCLANQNAFNTFYGGKPQFYSSGHHIQYTDAHTMLCHRGTLGHNTILPDGCTQKIGVEGYGWIPRHYESDRLAYVVGDASNAYGPTESKLWLMRAEQSDLDLSQAGGERNPGLKTYRRHIVDPGFDGLLFIYDELEAEAPIRWDYRLHSVAGDFGCEELDGAVRVTAQNGPGMSEAYIFTAGKPDCEVTDSFAVPAEDWMKGAGKQLPNHNHFTARTPAAGRTAILTIVDTHSAKDRGRVPARGADGLIHIDGWSIDACLDGTEFYFKAICDADGACVEYRENEPTVISENGAKKELSDALPILEM